MFSLIHEIKDEITAPFKDPRIYRSQDAAQIKGDQLLLLLIDETPESFQRGTIVTAQVTRILDGSNGKEGIVLCKLDNGLDARIEKRNLDNTDRRIEELIQVGHVVTGRIAEIKNKDDKGNFCVSLSCKRSDLESHRAYVD